MKTLLLHITSLLLLASTALAQDAEDHLRKGNEFYKVGDFANAKTEYLAARDMDIQDARAAFNLGNAMFRLNEFGPAVQQFDAVVSLSKDALMQAKAFHNKGNCLLSIKDYQASVEAFKEALRRDPGDDEARYNLVYAQQFSNLPVAVCRDTTLYLNTRGVAAVRGEWLNKGSHDNGEIVKVEAEPKNLYCENLGKNLVRMIVTDDEGNRSFCLANVILKDTLAPKAVCRVDTIRLDSIGIARVQAKRLDGGSTDNCSIAKHMARPNSFTSLGEHWVSLAVADSSGNIDSCRTKVIVEEYDPEKDQQEQQQNQENQDQQDQQENQDQQEKKDQQSQGDDEQDQEKQDQGKNGEGQDQQSGQDGNEGKNKDQGPGEPQQAVGLTKEQAEQLLKALEQDEKGTQQRIQKAIFGRKGKGKANPKTGKDW